MAEAVIVDEASFEDAALNPAGSSGVIGKDDVKCDGPCLSETDCGCHGDDITLSDHSNTSSNSQSQQETIHNSNHSTPSNSNSNPSPLNMQTESKSNTELSFHDLNAERESVSLEEEHGADTAIAIGNDDHSQDQTDQNTDADNDYDDLINDLINDPDNLLSQIDEHEQDLDDSDHRPFEDPMENEQNSNCDAAECGQPPSGSPPLAVQQEVQREYRRMLEDESKRLKAENERLLQRVESMRRVRSSIQNVVDQMQNAQEDAEQQHEEKDQESDGNHCTESKELEIHIEEMKMERDAINIARQNEEICRLESQRKRHEERRRLREENLARFHRSRMRKEQFHGHKSMRIRHGRDHHDAIKPGCNHPVRPGSRPICCRGCATNKHTASCNQRALKASEQWKRHSATHCNHHHQNHRCDETEEAMMRLITSRPPSMSTASRRYSKHRQHPSSSSIPSLPTPGIRSRSRSTSLSAFSSELQRSVVGAPKYRRRSIAAVPSFKSRPHRNGNGSSSSSSSLSPRQGRDARYRRSSFTLNAHGDPLRTRKSTNNNHHSLFCDKCRCRFNSMSELEAHQSVHHSPVSAAAPSLSGMGSPGICSPRLPSCIPELTSSFHTTMPIQTKNKFRYTKSDLTLPPPPTEVISMDSVSPRSAIDDHRGDDGEDGDDSKEQHPSSLNPESRSPITSVSSPRNINNGNTNGNGNGNNLNSKISSLPSLHGLMRRRRRRKSPPPPPSSQLGPLPPTQQHSQNETGIDHERWSNDMDHVRGSRGSEPVGITPECTSTAHNVGDIQGIDHRDDDDNALNAVTRSPPPRRRPPQPPTQRKRRRSLSQIFSTLLPNGNGGNKSDHEQMSDAAAVHSAEIVDDDDVKREHSESVKSDRNGSNGNGRSSKRRSLTAMLQSRLSGSAHSETAHSVSSLQVEVSDIDRLSVDHGARQERSRRRIDDLKKKLQIRKQRKSIKNTSNSKLQSLRRESRDTMNSNVNGIDSVHALNGVHRVSPEPHAEDEKMDIGDEGGRGRESGDVHDDDGGDDEVDGVDGVDAMGIILGDDHDSRSDNDGFSSLWEELAAVSPEIADQNDYVVDHEVQTESAQDTIDDDEFQIFTPPQFPRRPPSSQSVHPMHHRTTSFGRRSKRGSHRRRSMYTLRTRHPPNERPHHRRSNAIILPFITNEGADDHEHEEEEKSIQPIAMGSGNPNAAVQRGGEESGLCWDSMPRRDSRDLRDSRDSRERSQRTNNDWVRRLNRRIQDRRLPVRRPPNASHQTSHRNPFTVNTPLSPRLDPVRGRSSTSSSLSALHISDLHGHRPGTAVTPRSSSGMHRRRRHSSAALHGDPSVRSRRSHRRQSVDFSAHGIGTRHQSHHHHQRLPRAPPTPQYGRSSEVRGVRRGLHHRDRPSAVPPRPRLRQFVSSGRDPRDWREDGVPGPRSPELRRRSAAFVVPRRRRRRSAMDTDQIETASTSTSLAVNVNVNRDEDIARLLAQRDSLLQHFHDTIHSSSNSFDINALRQRTAHRRGHHRPQHGAGRASVDLTSLPVRRITESDLTKGSESGQTCSICQEKFKIGDRVKTLPCFHFFHVDEVDKWLTNHRECPVCRHSIDEINFK